MHDRLVVPDIFSPIVTIKMFSLMISFILYFIKIFSHITIFRFSHLSSRARLAPRWRRNLTTPVLPSPGCYKWFQLQKDCWAGVKLQLTHTQLSLWQCGLGGQSAQDLHGCNIFVIFDHIPKDTFTCRQETAQALWGSRPPPTLWRSRRPSGAASHPTGS